MPVSSKIIRVFVFSFLGALALGLTNSIADISKTGDWSAWRTLLVSLLVAAVSAAVRAVVAYLPILPDDDVGMTRG